MRCAPTTSRRNALSRSRNGRSAPCDARIRPASRPSASRSNRRSLCDRRTPSASSASTATGSSKTSSATYSDDERGWRRTRFSASPKRLRTAPQIRANRRDGDSLLEELSEIIGLQVYTHNGVLLGNVNNLVVDVDNGAV